MNLLLLLLLQLQFWEGSFSQEYQEFGLCVEKTLIVQEDLCVFIPCSFYYSQKYKNNNIGHGYWYHEESLDKPVATNDPKSAIQSWAKGRFNFIGNPQMDNCSLRINGVKKQDQGDYEFRIEKGKLKYSYRNDRVSLQVKDLTQKLKVHILKILEPSQQVTLACMVPGVCSNETPITFLWNGTDLSFQRQALPNTNSSRILDTFQAQENGPNLTCLVTFPEVTRKTGRVVHLRFHDISPWNSSLFLETMIQGLLVLFIFLALFFICLVICRIQMLRRKQSEEDMRISKSEISTIEVSNGIPLIRDMKHRDVEQKAVVQCVKRLTSILKSKLNGNVGVEYLIYQKT
ncbi:myeloid cell surface antigen CD33-like isoform X2 [Macrotis lagotis]|uniref:myeloid cell surface antigen CD33-like isoform X2 n=1 Tax=Macrotis lagotis TaxID=92651 RepID=UPI003D69190C